jgi:phosphatidylserine/phosphatidylglycerophosphate/cardiolipin synthase-like enzyme
VGGCNLAHPNQIDVMVSWQDKQTADWLSVHVQQLIEAGHSRTAFKETDGELKIDDKTRLLLDAGVRQQSLIYDESLKLIDAAQEWIFLTCQFFPGGRTGKHLLAARRRGVRVQIIYSSPWHHGSEVLGHYAYNLLQRTRFPSEFFKHQLTKDMLMLHTKLVATEQGALIGSHNLTTQGVRLGTAELALLRYETAFAQKLVSNQYDQLAKSGLELPRQ